MHAYIIWVIQGCSYLPVGGCQLSRREFFHNNQISESVVDLYTLQSILKSWERASVTHMFVQLLWYKRSVNLVVKADKMLCHDTVIPQPAAVYHITNRTLCPSSHTWFSLYLSFSLSRWQDGVCSNLKEWHWIAWLMCVSAGVWEADQSQQTPQKQIRRQTRYGWLIDCFLRLCEVSQLLSVKNSLIWRCVFFFLGLCAS